MAQTSQGEHRVIITLGQGVQHQAQVSQSFAQAGHDLLARYLGVTGHR